jgi:hypothetical protein
LLDLNAESKNELSKKATEWMKKATIPVEYQQDGDP